ncbi:MAG: SGNH/GDSL hydrolase family protein [Chitinophagales bacterium]|nr:SGNH/GDSL hydrolase family protein [Chitinophagales bacterium]
MWRKFIVLIAVSAATLIAAEIALRLAGYTPGKVIYSPWVKEIPKEKVSLLHGFATDSNGIFKADERAKKWIDSAIAAQAKNQNFFTDRSTKPWQVHEVYSLYYEALNMIHGRVKNPLQAAYSQLIIKETRNDIEQALIDYVHHPVNEEGFRSIRFKDYTSAKKKVLLLGDSFTWGHSAYDITNSFADILLSRGYAVYNTGISGADPAQYLAIAQKYIPLLRPDVVIVNFYSGNDVIYFDRKPEPYQPLFYTTNAGNIIAQPQHRYFTTADSAYQFAMACSYIPKRTPFNKLCSRTVASTFLWKLVSMTGYLNTIPVGYDAYFDEAQKEERTTPTANEELLAIQQIAKKSNARCEVVFIPETKRWNKLSTPTDYRGLADSIAIVIPQPITLAHYKKEDGHFNNEGHQVYADFLEQLINR